MGSLERTQRWLEHILTLRRVEREAGSADAASVRRDMEREVGPVVSRAMAARLLGVSQPALDRHIAAGGVASVITPDGRRQVPRDLAIELAEQIRAQRPVRHPLATVLRRRREAARQVDARIADLAGGSTAHAAHDVLDRRSLAYHRLIADRLEGAVLDEARHRARALEADGVLHPEHHRRWRDLLERAPAEVAHAITAEGERADELRRASPFAGLVTDEERRRVLSLVR